MDREAIARRQRRRQVAEALEEERGREEALVARLEDVVVEDQGAGIDAHVFARMQPDDAALVREVLATSSAFAEEEDEDVLTLDDEEPDVDDLEEEVARLQGEIADSRRRQLAYRRYLEILDA